MIRVMTPEGTPGGKAQSRGSSYVEGCRTLVHPSSVGRFGCGHWYIRRVGPLLIDNFVQVKETFPCLLSHHYDHSAS